MLVRTLLETNQEIPEFLEQFKPEGEDLTKLKFEAEGDFSDDEAIGGGDAAWGAGGGGDNGDAAAGAGGGWSTSADDAPADNAWGAAAAPATNSW